MSLFGHRETVSDVERAKEGDGSAPSHHLLARPPSFEGGSLDMVCRLAFVIVSVGTIAAVIYLSRNGTADIEYTVNGFVR